MVPDNHDADDEGAEPACIDRRGFLGATAGAGASLTLSRRAAATASGASADTGTATHDDTSNPTDAVSLLHGTRLRGRFEETSGVNVAQYAHAVNQLRRANANAGLVGVGDEFGRSSDSEFHGERAAEALDHLVPVVNAVGRREFDSGFDAAERRFRNATFPWVATNLRALDGEPVPGAKRWTVERVGDYEVGFFGAVAADVADDGTDDYRVLDPTESAREAVAVLKDRADLVVATSNADSATHDRLAREVDGVDAIAGPHTDGRRERVREVNDTVVSETGDGFGSLGAVHLDPATGDLVGWERHDLTVNPDALSEDPKMRAVVDRWRGRR